MTCEQVRNILDDYADGDLAEAEFQEVELHLASCAECRREERLLRALLAEAAALPRELPPGRDLWPDLAARLRGAEGARVVVRPAVPRWVRPAALAAAAAVVIALLGGLWTRGPRHATPVTPMGTLQPAAAGTAPAPLMEAEREYARATAALMAALDQQKDVLSPEARATLDANLKSIDDALAEVRAALQEDPANAQLTHLLTSTHQKKLDALERVVRLNRL
jgi:predicted anti-sigma-YlaC factor YlaD